VQVDADLAVEVPSEVFRPAEDSFLLLQAVVVRPGERFLEVGAGTGLLALHAAKVAELAVATDVNPHAVRCIRENAARNRLPVAVIRCDLLRGLRGTFDVIAFNPPYLAERIDGAWETRAWQGGATGEDVILRFLDELPGHLADGGRCYVTLPTNRERALAEIHERFDVRAAGEKAMFFEKLLALELTMPGVSQK
jgi:release factor glutamine methyltransferase